MNKKKLAALALSGTLLMGAAGFGAYSWFTSSASVNSNLIVETGTLNIKVEDNGNSVTKGWELQDTEENLGDNQTEASPQTKVEEGRPDFVNVRPGDSFIKKVTITNTGSLKERLKFTVNNQIVNDAYKDVVNVSINNVNSNGGSVDNLTDLNNTVLEPGKSITAEIKVQILTGTPGNNVDGKPEGNPNYQGKAIHLEGILENKELIAVNGEQVNKTPNVTNPTQR